MNAQDIHLTIFMDGARQFVIPVFQRDYSWGTKQCKQLWDDVLRVGRDTTAKAHFMGSVVYIGAEDINADVPRWLVIDGQQRLTTMTLLLIALRDRLKREAVTDDLPTTPEALEDRFLRNRHAKADRREKLALRRIDHDTLTALVQSMPLPSPVARHIHENYKFFADLLNEADLAAVWRGIGKLVCVHVSLTRGQDDPQLIFESLNSTGLDLTQADLIRNFVLMRLDEVEQTRQYIDHWQPIEAAFGARYRTDFDKFVRDYLTLQLRPSKQLKAAEIYRHFRTFFLRESATRGVGDILAELRRFGTYFVSYSLGREEVAALRVPFRRLEGLVDVATPVMLRLYDCYENLKTLTEKEFAQAAELLESYVFRRSVCDMQTRSLGQIFATLAYRINDRQPLASLQVALARQGKNRRFPSDTEFRGALASRNVYDMRQSHYLLDRLENDSKEQIDTSTLTIEHVLPQNPELRPEWRGMLGDDWKATQEAWVHRLGNVTLTGYNSEYSDRPFPEKKTIKKGFNESPLRLNKFIREQSTWTEKEMEERGRNLSDRATGIWKPLVVDRALVREAELHDLRTRAAGFSAEKLEMEPDVRLLFDELRKQVMALGDDVVELFGSKTATYRVFDFFLEIIPRKNRLTLLLNLDVDDCGPLPEPAWDTAQNEFVMFATQDAGVGYSLKRASDVSEVMKLVRLAYEKVAE